MLLSRRVSISEPLPEGQYQGESINFLYSANIDPLYLEALAIENLIIDLHDSGLRNVKTAADLYRLTTDYQLGIPVVDEEAYCEP